MRRAAALEVVSGTHQIGESTLEKWLSLVKGQPEHAWLYLLVDRYVGRVSTAEMDAAAWECLKADYLRPERPTAKAAIRRLRRAAAEHGWKLPSMRTMERRLDAIPRVVRVMARDGKKAAAELYPAQARSRMAMSALEIINGDGYLHNLWVEFPDGEIRRVKTWFWQDVYSSKILCWRTDKTEHTDLIRLSFGDVVEQYGIPDAALMDNTLAAANKTMSGGIKHRFRFKVKEDEPLGVFPLLNVRVMWAEPGHGQSKPIERTFGRGGIGEYVDKAPDFAGAWTGGSPLDKPEYDGKTKTVSLAALEVVIAREVAAFNAQEERRSPIHQGRSYDAVFNESYERSTIRRATEAQRRLWLLATEPVRCAPKDGAISLDAGRITRTDIMPTQANRYWAPALVEYASRQVVARFDPKRLHEGVHVYSLDGRYIAFADCFAPQGFADQGAGREHQRNRKTFVRAAKTMLTAERRMDVLQAAKHLPGNERPTAVDLTIPAPAVIRADFRNPIERPPVVSRELNAAEQVFMEQAEAELQAPSVNVHELRSDTAKDAHWRALDERRTNGETLAEQDEQFWKAWQGSSFFRIQRELDTEFEERIAARA